MEGPYGVVMFTLQASDMLPTSAQPHSSSLISHNFNMFSLRSILARRAKIPICMHSQRPNRNRTPPSSRPLSTITPPPHLRLPIQHRPALPLKPSLPTQKPTPFQSHPYTTKTSIDALLENLQDQYATARDEFEIAAEETEKKSVYAADDRAAAREELDKLKGMFAEALKGDAVEEVTRRVGTRIRELEGAVVALEEKGLED